jgi:uncharacterized protein
MTAPPAPVPVRERILALDVLRGFALLGILVMNIQSFAMIYSAYLNPTAYGNLEGINLWVWLVSHVFADQKFISLFSMLFGAGIVLMAQHVETGGSRPGGLHYRRMFWLLLIGLGHAYLVWHSDILVTYALCGLVVYLFRKVRPSWLSAWGLLAVTVPFLLWLAAGSSMPLWPSDAIAGIRSDWSPSPEQVAAEVEIYRGGWLDQMAHRIPTAIEFQTFVFAIWTAWRAGGLMLLGMALWKWGVLSAQRSTRFYVALIAASSVLGFLLILLGVTRNFAADWAVTYSMFIGSQFNYWGSMFVALAYVGLVMLVVKTRVLRWLQHALAAVGRTALSNYLGQSLVCTLIFYGHGFGLFGNVDRWQQALIVFGVWGLQIGLSLAWLRCFRFGPAEWVWRSLTYWKCQPLRREPGPSVPPALLQH